MTLCEMGKQRCGIVLTENAAGAVPQNKNRAEEKTLQPVYHLPVDCDIIRKAGSPWVKRLPASVLAPTGGFEPLACRLGGGRSILLSYVGEWTNRIVTQFFFCVKHFF